MITALGFWSELKLLKNILCVEFENGTVASVNTGKSNLFLLSDPHSQTVVLDGSAQVAGARVFLMPCSLNGNNSSLPERVQFILGKT